MSFPKVKTKWDDMFASQEIGHPTKKCTTCPTQVVIDERSEPPENVANKRKCVENLCEQLDLKHLTRYLDIISFPNSSFLLCDLCLETLQFFLWSKEPLTSFFGERGPLAEWTLGSARKLFVDDLKTVLQPVIQLPGGFEEGERRSITFWVFDILRNGVAQCNRVPI